MESATHKVINYFVLCRLCLEKHGISDIFGIPGLIDDIMLLTGVEVTSSHNLPQKICMRCLEVVVKARRLRDQASANDKHLKSLFAPDDTGKEGSISNSQQNDVNDNLNSSYDSDNPKLQIDEDAGMEDSKPNIRCSFETTDDDTTVKMLSVRKDLFDSTAIESSPTKELDPFATVTIITSESIKMEKDASQYECESSPTKELKPFETVTILTNNSIKKGNAVSQYECESSPTKDVKPFESVTILTSKSIKKEKGVTQYECEHCEKTFDVWKKYYLHQRSHNRKIVCPLEACGKRFAIKGDLEKHIRAHTGEKPYKCDFCGKGFTQRGSLKVHRGTVHAHQLKRMLL